MGWRKREQAFVYDRIAGRFVRLHLRIVRQVSCSFSNVLVEGPCTRRRSAATVLLRAIANSHVEAGASLRNVEPDFQTSRKRSLKTSSAVLRSAVRRKMNRYTATLCRAYKARIAARSPTAIRAMSASSEALSTTGTCQVRVQCRRQVIWNRGALHPREPRAHHSATVIGELLEAGSRRT